ncbi:hypothetical protein EAI_17196 [Harpegnathos saltator]|uniref:Uncharacterized protein n=1 Tax=Harpegnathos saltator TaxID=610380 RepID=E2B8N6_HARSA|nr:hypothetical protein EAI_17196 [Harpegnathos saltator]
MRFGSMAFWRYAIEGVLIRFVGFRAHGIPAMKRFQDYGTHDVLGHENLGVSEIFWKQKIVKINQMKLKRKVK